MIKSAWDFRTFRDYYLRLLFMNESFSMHLRRKF